MSCSNDNTNSAVAASRNLASDEFGGDCKMHLINLAIEHAFGKRTRTSNGEIVDEFVAGNNILSVGRALVNAIMSKRKKAVDDLYLKRNAGFKVFKIPIDNDTRISGTYRLLTSSIRSKFLLGRYLIEESRSVQQKYEGITSNWDLVVQFEAILRQPVAYSLKVQQDVNVSVGLSWFRIVLLKASVKVDEYKIVDLDAEAWDGRKTFKNLPTTELEVGMMDDDAQLLISRLKDDYFKAPKQIELIALVLDPVVWTLAQAIFKKHDCGRIEQAWKITETEFKAVLATKAVVDRNIRSSIPEATTSTPSPIALDEDESSNDSTLFGELMARVNSPVDSTRISVEQPKNPLDELKDWKNLKVNWIDELKLQHSTMPAKIGKLSQAKLKAKMQNPEFVSGNICILKWWKRNQSRFPILASIALRVLAKPDSNGFQERVFSKAKIVDSALRQRLDRFKYEMLVLQAVNHSWLRKNNLALSSLAKTGKKCSTENDMAKNVEQLAAFYEDEVDSGDFEASASFEKLYNLLGQNVEIVE